MIQEHARALAAWSPAPGRARAAAAGDGREAFSPALALSRLPAALDALAVAVLAFAVLPRLAFHALPPAERALAGSAVWSLAYLAACGAAPLVRALDRRIDPRARRIAARALFAASTLSLAFLPQAPGAALVLLAAARIGQGLGLAGLAGGARTAEPRAAAGVQGWILAALLGTAAAAAVLGLPALLLTPGDFTAWGWRCAFVMALAVNVPALAADLHLQSGPKGRPQLRLAAVRGAQLRPR